MLGVQRLGLALRIGAGQDLVVVDVAALLHLAWRTLAATTTIVSSVCQIAHYLVHTVLDRSVLPCAQRRRR